jgi:hypothetical protein
MMADTERNPFMWQYYRSTFIPTQILILVICAALSLYWGVPLGSLVIYFLIMEVFGIFGAMWSARQLRKFEDREGLLRNRH